MSRRFGEKKAIPVKRLRKATPQEKEFIRLGNDFDDEDDDFAPERDRAVKRISKISDRKIEEATDRVIMGESIGALAKELNVTEEALAKKIKTYVGMRYMREWQQSVRFDCLRAELILKRSLTDFVESGNVGSGKLALEVLNYRAKVLSFGAVNPQEQSIRVAGLTQEQLFNAILEQL